MIDGSEKCNIVKAAFELQSLRVLERRSKNNWLYYIKLLCFSNKGKSMYYGNTEILMFFIPPRKSIVCNYRAASQRAGARISPGCYEHGREYFHRKQNENTCRTKITF